MLVLTWELGVGGFLQPGLGVAHCVAHLTILGYVISLQARSCDKVGFPSSLDNVQFLFSIVRTFCPPDFCVKLRVSRPLGFTN